MGLCVKRAMDVLVNVTFRCVCEGCSGGRFAFESVNQVKQLALPSVSGLHSNRQ